MTLVPYTCRPCADTLTSPFQSHTPKATHATIQAVTASGQHTTMAPLPSIILLLVCWVCSLAAAPSPPLPGATKPSPLGVPKPFGIVLALLDDYGVENLQAVYGGAQQFCYKSDCAQRTDWYTAEGRTTGEGTLTPHTERLMSEGVTFTKFYAMPQCAVSRATLLSGRCVFKERDCVVPARCCTQTNALESVPLNSPASARPGPSTLVCTDLRLLTLSCLALYTAPFRPLLCHMTQVARAIALISHS